MTDLSYRIIDGDFPAGVKNKTATLVASESDALLFDAGVARADGHRLAAAVLDSGRQLTTVVISHADPDFYFGAEVIADSFPGAQFLATPEVAAAMAKKYEGKLKAWAALGANLPTRLIETELLTGDLQFAGHTFELKGAPTAPPAPPAAPPPTPSSSRAPPRRCPTAPTSTRPRTARSSAACSSSPTSTS